jgi:hypothetical protein
MGQIGIRCSHCERRFTVLAMHFLVKSAFGRTAAAIGVLALTACSSTPKVEKTLTTAYREGMPGGTLVETYRLTVTVAAIDPINRKLTLTAADGSQNVFTAGAGDEHFDKLRVGDHAHATVTRVLIVLLGEDAAALEEGPIIPAVLTPEDARSGLLKSDAMQRTARIGTVDRKLRQATIVLADGASKTFPIRKDVDPRQIKSGEEVVIRSSSTVVLTQDKP